MSKKRVWTGDQKNAIEARGGGLLVSAAAGSGKTPSFAPTKKTARGASMRIRSAVPMVTASSPCGKCPRSTCSKRIVKSA